MPSKTPTPNNPFQKALLPLVTLVALATFGTGFNLGKISQQLDFQPDSTLLQHKIDSIAEARLDAKNQEVLRKHREAFLDLELRGMNEKAARTKPPYRHPNDIDITQMPITYHGPKETWRR